MAIVTGSHSAVGATAEPWCQQMKTAVRSSEELLRLLDLPPLCDERLESAVASFPVFVPRNFLAKMKQGDPSDPLLKQVLPSPAETEPFIGFQADPVGDTSAQLEPFLLKKYHGRTLLITTGACAIHCRYCFRRHYPYHEATGQGDALLQAVERIREDDSIDEVILSGGDPLTLVDSRIEEIYQSLARISHVRRLRIHTRLPIVIPERVTHLLRDILVKTRLKTVFVVHVNHPRELTGGVGPALQSIASLGVPVLNQSVLLSEVNDSIDTLSQLSLKLIDYSVMPYYLHQLDRVQGSHHFEVARSRGLKLIEGLRKQLPGYAVPRYVCEEPGAAHKTPIG